MPDNDFYANLKISKDQKIHADFDSFYKRIYGPNIQIKRYDKDPLAQKDYGVDVILILSNGIRISIDEKLRSAKYASSPEYPIELESNVQWGKKGWLFTNIYQYICFGNCNPTNNGLVSYFMFPCDFHFKNFILNSLKDLKIRRASTNNLYETEFCLVHWTKIQRYAGRNECHQFGLERYDNENSNQ
jgi:hypothetical protein